MRNETNWWKQPFKESHTYFFYKKKKRILHIFYYKLENDHEYLLYNIITNYKDTKLSELVCMLNKVLLNSVRKNCKRWRWYIDWSFLICTLYKLQFISSFIHNPFFFFFFFLKISSRINKYFWPNDKCPNCENMYFETCTRDKQLQ